MRFTTAVLLMAAVFAVAISVAGNGSGLDAPIALQSLPSGGFVVLGFKGTISEFSGSNGQYTVSKKFDIPVNQYPSDFAIGKVANRDDIFVTSNITSGPIRNGRVSEYRQDGQLVQYWDVKGVATGVDFDGGSLFLATADTNELYSIKFSANQTGEVSYVGEVSGVERIGPLALDLEGSKVYVGDAASGGVYSYDLRSRRSVLLTESVGDVGALRINRATGRLLAADDRHHQILSLSITSPSKPSKVSVSVPLKHPAGLDFIDHNLLAIGDSDLEVILFVANDGHVVSEFQ